MSKTLAIIRGQVRSFCDETTASDWSDAELNRLINVYYHKLRSAAIAIYEDYYLTTTTFSSVANQEEYTSSNGAPTDVYKIRRVELNFDVSAASGAPTRCLPLFNIDAVRRDLAYQNAGIGLKVYGNSFYYTYGFGSSFTIGFIPMPNNTGTNAIKIWYIKEAIDLASDSSTIDIPYADNYWLLAAYGATAEALRFGNQEPDAANSFEDKYLKGMLLMQEELEDRIAEEGKSVIDTSGEITDYGTGAY